MTIRAMNPFAALVIDLLPTEVLEAAERNELETLDGERLRLLLEQSCVQARRRMAGERLGAQIEELKTRLRSAEPDVRAQAIWNLTQIGAREAEPEIRQLSGDFAIGMYSDGDHMGQDELESFRLEDPLWRALLCRLPATRPPGEYVCHLRYSITISAFADWACQRLGR